MTEKKPLTPKQEKFTCAIAAGMTQADAYRHAYNVRPRMTPESIWVAASGIMTDPKVRSRVSALREQIAQHTVLEAADVLDEIRRIAFADPGGIMNTDGSIKRIDQLNPELRATVASYEVTKDGTIKYKFWDKLAALEKACRYLGLYERDNHQKKDALTQLLESLSGNVKGVVLEAECKRVLSGENAGRVYEGNK